MYIFLLLIMSLPVLPVTHSIRFCSIFIFLFFFFFFFFWSNKEYSKCFINLNIVFFYKMLINADVVKEVPEVLYIAMIDSLRQKFYPRMRKADRERKISDSHRKGYSFPFCEKYQCVQQLYYKTVLRFTLND